MVEAEARYRRALSIWPDHADAHNNLGIVLAEQSKFIEAEEQYQQAMALKPGFPDPHNNLGLALMWQGKIAEAVALYRQALALKPDYVEAYTNLAMALVTAEEFAVALAALRCAFGVKETNEARSLVVHCLKHWRSTQDVGDLREFVSRALSEGWDRPVELARVSAAIIKKNPGVGESIERATNAWPRRLSAERAVGGFRPRGCLRGSAASMPARIHSDLGHRDGAVSDRRPLRAAPACRGGHSVGRDRGTRARFLLCAGAPVLRQRICLCLRR